MQQEKFKVRGVVYVHLEGGASPWDTITPLPETAPNEYRGEFEPIQTAISGLTVSEHFPRIATLADRISFIRAIDSLNSDHFKSTKNLLVQNGNPLGTSVGSTMNNAIIPYTFLNPEGQYQNDAATIKDHHSELAMRIDWNTVEKRFKPPEVDTDASLQERHELLQFVDNLDLPGMSVATFTEMRNRAFSVLCGTGSYFDAFTISSKELERFGVDVASNENQFGHAAALSSALVQNGAGFVTIHHCEKNGWDMHNGKTLREQLPELSSRIDIGIAELIHDAVRYNFLVVCSSEFGRTPKINGSGGRDHHNVHFAFGAGGLFQPGTVYGVLSTKGEITDERITNPQLYRLVQHAAGISEDNADEFLSTNLLRY
ncbi:DUF1501 domain-containing protein [Candidatus Peribacteria bacterium]|nr:DUF1501 domain-containing protein [Candidatus Peribacteria bacterium]